MSIADTEILGLVDWATNHAKARGAPWWKSFFTGKSKSLGGIPHDAFGMTSLSVREYVTGIYRELDLEESKISKIQTGGKYNHAFFRSSRNANMSRS